MSAERERLKKIVERALEAQGFSDGWGELLDEDALSEAAAAVVDAIVSVAFVDAIIEERGGVVEWVPVFRLQGLETAGGCDGTGT